MAFWVVDSFGKRTNRSVGQANIFFIRCRPPSVRIIFCCRCHASVGCDETITPPVLNFRWITFKNDFVLDSFSVCFPCFRFSSIIVFVWRLFSLDGWSESLAEIEILSLPHLARRKRRQARPQRALKGSF